MVGSCLVLTDLANACECTQVRCHLLRRRCKAITECISPRHVRSKVRKHRASTTEATGKHSNTPTRRSDRRRLVDLAKRTYMPVVVSRMQDVVVTAALSNAAHMSSK